MIDYPRTSFGWSSTSPADWADPTEGLVVHYNGPATGLDNHAECVDYWEDTRTGHVSGNGWADIGYSFGVSVDGHIFEGRGLHRYQAAQGTTHGNANYYSVTLMIGGSEQPTAAQIEGVRRLRQWLMDDHGVAGTVLGHRDFVSTSCPGEPLYALVTDGTFTQPPGAPAPTTGETLYVGLKYGDSGERVKSMQRILVQAGQYDTLQPYGVDGHYGDATAEALMLARQAVGSSVTEPIHTVTGETEAQILVAMARDQARRFAPSCDCDTSSGTGAASLEGATITSKITRVEA